MSDKPEESSQISQISQTSAFDADALFRQHRGSVAWISDKVSLGPNKLDNTLGSGFAIDRLESPSGSVCRIATDNHVVRAFSPEATVNMADGKAYPFTVELRDEANDLAILKVPGVSAEVCQPLVITDQEKPVAPGDPVLKLGARGGYANSTEGVVETYFTRADARALPLLPGENASRVMLSAFKKDRNTVSGDSGGPILGADGKVIAVMDAEGQTVMGATPAHFLLKDLQQLKAQDKQ